MVAATPRTRHRQSLSIPRLALGAAAARPADTADVPLDTGRTWRSRGLLTQRIATGAIDGGSDDGIVSVAPDGCTTNTVTQETAARLMGVLESLTRTHSDVSDAGSLGSHLVPAAPHCSVPPPVQQQRSPSLSGRDARPHIQEQRSHASGQSHLRSASSAKERGDNETGGSGEDTPAKQSRGEALLCAANKDRLHLSLDEEAALQGRSALGRSTAKAGLGASLEARCQRRPKATPRRDTIAVAHVARRDLPFTKEAPPRLSAAPPGLVAMADDEANTRQQSSADRHDARHREYGTMYSATAKSAAESAQRSEAAEGERSEGAAAAENCIARRLDTDSEKQGGVRAASHRGMARIHALEAQLVDQCEAAQRAAEASREWEMLLSAKEDKNCALQAKLKKLAEATLTATSRISELEAQLAAAHRDASTAPDAAVHARIRELEALLAERDCESDSDEALIMAAPEGEEHLQASEETQRDLEKQLAEQRFSAASDDARIAELAARLAEKSEETERALAALRERDRCLQESESRRNDVEERLARHLRASASEAEVSARVAELEALLVAKEQESEVALAQAMADRERSLQAEQDAREELGRCRGRCKVALADAATNATRLRASEDKVRALESQLLVDGGHAGSSCAGVFATCRRRLRAPQRAEVSAQTEAAAQHLEASAQTGVAMQQLEASVQTEAATWQLEASAQTEAVVEQLEVSAQTEAASQQQEAAAQTEMAVQQLEASAQTEAGMQQVEGSVQTEAVVQQLDASAQTEAALLSLGQEAALPAQAQVVSVQVDAEAQTQDKSDSESLQAALRSACAHLGTRWLHWLHRSGARRLIVPVWQGFYLSFPREEEATAPGEHQAVLPDSDPPLLPDGHAWDWPLSRHEKKERLVFLKSQMLLADQRALLDHVALLQHTLDEVGCEGVIRPALREDEAE